MPAIRHRWSTAEVRALMDESRAWPRYELIDGELIVTPAPGAVHQIAVTEVLRLIADYVEREDIGVAFVSPADLELRAGTITQPDVFVVARGRAAEPDPEFSWRDVTTLLLAVEIISPSSIRTDRVEKRDYYMNAGVPDYWVMDLDARVIEQWTPQRETPVVARTVLEWRPAEASAVLTIALPALFDGIWSKFRNLSGR